MTAPDPAWVEAGVAALGTDFVDPLAVEAVIAAVEPLIRADVVREVALDTAAGIVDPGLRAALRDEVLADLRDKVRLIPAHAVRMEHKWMNGQGWVPTAEVIVTVPLAAVLALIEEAE